MSFWFQLLVALDNGSVEQVSLKFSDETENDVPSFFFLEREHCIQEHDDIITAMDITCDGKNVVTSSYDKCVVCLEVTTLRLETRMNDAHSDLISNLSANKVEPSMIATAANDGTVKTWDLKTSTEQQSK